MDPQLFEMMQSRFDKVDATLDVLQSTIQTHTEMDATYWKKIDQQEAQLSLLKKVFYVLLTLLSTAGGYLGIHR